MDYETIITGLCLGIAAAIIYDTFKLIRWRNRAERAEAALARIEATIAACEAEVIQ